MGKTLPDLHIYDFEVSSEVESEQQSLFTEILSPLIANLRLPSQPKSQIISYQYRYINKPIKEIYFKLKNRGPPAKENS